MDSKSPDGNIFTKSDRSNENNTHVINIKQFKQENAGNYELVLKNNLGEISSQGQVEMKGVPPTFIIEPQAAAVVKGKMAEIICRVAGSPKPEVHIVFFPPFFLSTNGMLLIVYLGAMDIER